MITAIIFIFMISTLCNIAVVSLNMLSLLGQTTWNTSSRPFSTQRKYFYNFRTTLYTSVSKQIL